MDTTAELSSSEEGEEDCDVTLLHPMVPLAAAAQPPPPAAAAAAPAAAAAHGHAGLDDDEEDDEDEEESFFTPQVGTYVCICMHVM